ncbi:hypothetical protein HBDW_12760 [Herbaspirillum sp. DW155]|uniref:hypothetical protein n=1 Tax=Herbaspirillum sp. DW155 TaxID=3095609 RepID=UPI003093823C|nr:hypothetical protein HBDW_12760 [Herbaspirillum sp. DW155]
MAFADSGNLPIFKNRYKAEIRQNKAGKFTKLPGFQQILRLIAEKGTALRQL